MLKETTRAGSVDQAVAGRIPIALVSRGVPDLSKLRDAPIVRQLLVDQEPYIFLENDGVPSFPRDAGVPASIYFSRCTAIFARIIVDPAIRLLIGPWSRAFLTQLYAMVRPGGELIVPVWCGSKAKVFGRWRSEDLQAFFGVDAEPLEDSGFVRVVRGTNVPRSPASAARWFADNAHEVLLQHAIDNARHMEFAEPATVFAEQTPEAARAHGSSYLAKERQTFSKAQAYYVGGISYKEPVIRHIIEDQLGKSRPIELIDVGGGYGLLAVELAMDAALNVTHATCVDISAVNERLAARYYADMADAIHGRFSFVRAAAQDYAFDRTYDVIMSVGALLYVPRDRLQKLVDDAWSALRPGGVLIVHENIKNPRYTRDYNFMFTVEEIDKLLLRFGEITRYASNLCQRLTLEQTGEKTVFRAVRKPI